MPENSLGNVFFSLQLILQFRDGVQRFYYRENYTFPRTWRGSYIFRGGGGHLFPGGGVQMLISIGTPITCDFPGGNPETPIPLWIHTWYWYIPGNWYCIFRVRGYLVLYLFNPGSGYLFSTVTSLLIFPDSTQVAGSCSRKVSFFFKKKNKLSRLGSGLLLV